jgi:hypothetical protein
MEYNGSFIWYILPDFDITKAATTLFLFDSSIRYTGIMGTVPPDLGKIIPWPAPGISGWLARGVSDGSTFYPPDFIPRHGIATVFYLSQVGVSKGWTSKPFPSLNHKLTITQMSTPFELKISCKATPDKA